MWDRRSSLKCSQTLSGAPARPSWEKHCLAQVRVTVGSWWGRKDWNSCVLKLAQSDLQEPTDTFSGIL